MKYEKKEPQDYALYAFRIDEKDKEWVTTTLKQLKRRINANRPKDTYVMTGNDILLEALRIGFEKLKRG